MWENGRHVLEPLILVEMGREAATIVMLAAAGILAGASGLQRFCFFMIAFGIWDIFYYVWLWVILRWPESLMTWDLLFYLPLPWVGPVITPVLISATMIAAGSILICLAEKGYAIRWRRVDWAIETGLRGFSSLSRSAGTGRISSACPTARPTAASPIPLPGGFSCRLIFSR